MCTNGVFDPCSVCLSSSTLSTLFCVSALLLFLLCALCFILSPIRSNRNECVRNKRFQLLNHTHTHVEHADLLDFNWNVDAFNPGLYSIISFHVRMCEYIFLFFMGCCYISHGSLLIINRKKKNGTYEWNEKNEASIRWWKRSEWENERALTN